MSSLVRSSRRQPTPPSRLSRPCAIGASPDRERRRSERHASVSLETARHCPAWVFMNFSQNRTASSIHPSALVPVPGPKPWPRFLYLRYATSVPALRRAATRLSNAHGGAMPFVLAHDDEGRGLGRRRSPNGPYRPSRQFDGFGRLIASKSLLRRGCRSRRPPARPAERPKSKYLLGTLRRASRRNERCRTGQPPDSCGSHRAAFVVRDIEVRRRCTPLLADRRGVRQPFVDGPNIREATAPGAMICERCTGLSAQEEEACVLCLAGCSCFLRLVL